MNQLPPGVTLIDLIPHRDDRGQFTEIFREEWRPATRCVQWNVVHSEPQVLRGLHAHLVHEDYLTVISGEALIVLKDLRRESPTFGLVSYVPLSGREPRVICIPTRVGHGFYFPVASIHVYSVTAYWNKADELGCRFDDEKLGIEWPNPEPRISDRDRDLPGYDALLRELDTRTEGLARDTGRT